MFSSFFLGANSGHGFHSFYDDLIPIRDAKTIYILKGGPGSGKSTLMRKVLSEGEKRGLPTEKIFCSSDPDSLDGVIFPTLGVALADGTAPHVLEPQLPLAVERYVNLGEAADIKKIQTHKNEIAAVKSEYSGFFTSVYRMTSCAEKLDNELFERALGSIGADFLKKKARGIISREIPKKGNGGIFLRRFCEAISPKGYISLLSDENFGDMRTYIIEDSYGLAHFLLTALKDAALNNGHDCIGAYSPLKPEQLVHLFLPTLSLCFVSSSRDIPQKVENAKKLRLDYAVERALDSSSRLELKRLRKLRTAFIEEACNVLKDAKLVHDKLESIYNPYIDFESIFALADKIAREIFG